VIDGRLTPIRDLRVNVPPALASIAYKALSLKPSHRYSTALKMAQDVEAFLADQPVAAHKESWLARSMRVARHNRSATQTAMVGLAIGSILAVIAFLTLGAYATRERFLRKDAQAAQTEAAEAQQKAERLRSESMALSAKFLANSIANEIDLRWRILEAEASSPILRQLIVELNQKVPNASVDPNRDDGGLVLDELNPERAELQNWLQARYIDNQRAVKSDSWFVQGAEGTQLARVRPSESIGRNYRHRDYFHAFGHDLDVAEMIAANDQPKPLAGKLVYMSVAYQSTNTNALQVSFSVPIYDAEVEQYARKKIGVMAMSVELGDFAMDPNTWLIDTRPDQYEGQRGMLLQHPKLGQRSETDLLPHLDEGWVSQMLERRRERMRRGAQTGGGHSVGSVSNIRDPIEQTTTMAATEPIIVRGRPAEIADTGWIVVVTETD